MINPITMGLNYNNYMSDPYFIYALQSYNPNFRGAQTQLQENYSGVSTQTNNGTVNSLSNTTTQAAEDSDSNTGMIVGGVITAALATGALLYAGKRGNGNIWTGLKNIFGRKATKPMSAFTLNAKDGSIITVQKGKVSQISKAGKSVEITDAKEITNKANELGVTLPRGSHLNGSELVPGVELTKYGLDFEGKSLIIENGKLIGVGNIVTRGTTYTKMDMTPKAVEDFLASLNDAKKAELESIISGISKGETKNIEKIKNVISYKYSNKGTTYTRDTVSKKETFTVPKYVELNETQIKSYLQQNPEVESTVNKLIAKGRVKGVERGTSVHEADDGTKFYLNEKGEIEEIVLLKKTFLGKKQPETLEKGSDEFYAYLHDHKEIKTAIENEYNAGLAPDGIDTHFVIK